MIIYAEKDFLCKGQAEHFLEKLHACGVPCKEYHSTRFLDNHAYTLNMNTHAAKGSRQAMYDYLEEFAAEKDTNQE